MEESSVRLKLLIDTSRVKRVMFAEAGKDFVDFLFHILSLPVATIIRRLQGQELKGSLPNLFQSLEDLNYEYIQPSKTTDFLLKPVCTTKIPLLDPNYACNENFYGCNNRNCNSKVFYVSQDPSSDCPHCNTPMTKNLWYVKPPRRGLVNGEVTYMVMDDLEVIPMSNISAIALLNKMEIKDTGALEEKVVDFRTDEALKLLKAALGSKNVLTEVFC